VHIAEATATMTVTDNVNDVGFVPTTKLGSKPPNRFPFRLEQQMIEMPHFWMQIPPIAL
jgi:hypothetical protein